MAVQLAAREIAPGDAIAAVVLVRMATLWGSVAVGLPCLAFGLRRLR